MDTVKGLSFCKGNLGEMQPHLEKSRPELNMQVSPGLQPVLSISVPFLLSICCLVLSHIRSHHCKTILKCCTTGNGKMA